MISDYYETLLPIPDFSPKDLLRFYSKIKIDPITKCWDWVGTRTNRYGQFRIKYDQFVASRVAYKIHYNEDPGNLFVLHSCDNSFCVKKEHLELGNQITNINDCVLRGRHPGAAFTKLSDLDVAEIFELFEKDVPVKEIAKIKDVSTSHTYSILRGDLKARKEIATLI